MNRPTLEDLMRENGTLPPHNCPACPTEIRNLFAVAHNLVSLVDRRGSPCKISDKIESLRRAVQEVQPLVDEHFKGEGN